MKFISIFVEDRVGVIAELATKLAENNIDIESLDTEKGDEHTVITLAIDKHEDALKVLKKNHYKVFSNDIMLLTIENKQGVLSNLTVKLMDSDIEVRSIRIVKTFSDHSLVALDTNNNEKTLGIVKEYLTV